MSREDSTVSDNEELLEKYRRLLIESRGLGTRLFVINEIANTVSSLADLEDVFKVIVTRGKWVLDYHISCICTLSEDGGHYIVHTHFDTSRVRRVISPKDRRFKLGQGIAGWVMERGEPVVVPDITHEPRSDPSADSEVFGADINSLLSLPLMIDGKVAGSLNFGSKEKDAYSQEDLRIARLLGLQAGVALKNRLLLQQLSKANSELESAKEGLERTVDERTAQLRESKERYRVILEINNAIISNLELGYLLPAIAKIAKYKLPFDDVSIKLYEPSRDVLKVYALETFFPFDNLAPGREVPREGSHVGWVIDNRKPMVVHDLSKELRFPQDKIAFEAGLRSYVVIPLINDERVIGALSIGSKMPYTFGDDEIQFLSLVAKQIALAIDNARSHEEIKGLKDELEKENIYLKEEVKTEYNFEEIIGESKALNRALHQVEMVAKSDSNVLIRGETGTGKELVARAIHNLSTRGNRPLIRVNCPAIPPGLIESELFGHEKGAFTGALSRKIGKFELADKGTIFLDEVGDLPLEAQSKLLRVLQEREFERVGGTETHKVDVRVIAATNRDLERAVKEGEFRTDLFYRLNVFPITLPPLRERKEDIPLLTTYFASKYVSRLGKEIKSISERSIERLKEYLWPGNIRELENIVERAVILTTGDTLEIRESLLGLLAESDASPRQEEPLRLEELEREHIIKVLSLTGWQIHGDRGAAKILGLNPSTLRSRMNRLGIKRGK